MSEKKIGDVIVMDGVKYVVTGMNGNSYGLAPYTEKKINVDSIIDGLEEVEAPKEKKKRGK